MKKTTKKYKIVGMDCDSCAKILELDLEDAGIKASCSYTKEVLEVEYNNKISDEKIKEIVASSGYKVVN